MGKLDIALRDIISNIPHKFIKILTGKEAVELLDNTFPSLPSKNVKLTLSLK